MTPGLADPEAVSIESPSFPGFFLRHRNNALVLNADDGTESLRGDVTWWIRPGLADSSWLSFESYNQPGSYIGRRFGVTALVELTNLTTDRARQDATFLEEK